MESDGCQSSRINPLARARKLADSFGPDGGCERGLWDRDQRGPMEHPSKGLSELLVGHGRRRHGVDRTNEAIVDEGARVKVGEVVEIDPGQPLAAVADASTETGQEHRANELEHPTGCREHDAGPDRHDAEAAVSGRIGRCFPTIDHLGQESLSAPGCLVEQLIASISAVVTDRGCGEENPGAPRPDHRFSELAGRSDAARSDRPLVRFCETSGNGRAGKVDDCVDVLEDPRVGIVRVPGALEVGARDAPDETEDSVACGREERAECGADQAR